MGQAFDSVQAFRIRNLTEGLHDAAALLQERDRRFHVQLFEVTTGLLSGEQLLHFSQGEGSGPFRMLIDPLNEFGQGSTFPEQTEGFGGRRKLAVHPCQKTFQRQVAKFTDRQSQGFRTLADGGIAQLTLELTAENVADRVTIEAGDTGKILLVPTFFLDQASDFASQFGSFLGRGHPSALLVRPTRPIEKWEHCHHKAEKDEGEEDLLGNCPAKTSQPGLKEHGKIHSTGLPERETGRSIQNNKLPRVS